MIFLLFEMYLFLIEFANLTADIFESQAADRGVEGLCALNGSTQVSIVGIALARCCVS